VRQNLIPINGHFVYFKMGYYMKVLIAINF